MNGCNYSPKTDFYKHIPKYSKLTGTALAESEQIFATDRYLILVINYPRDEESYDPHLAFYNKDGKLEAACYFPSEQINNVQNGVVTAFLNESRSKRKSLYRNDLPEGFSLDLVTNDATNGIVCNKIIQSISMDTATLAVSFIVNSSNDLYSGLHWTPATPDIERKKSFPFTDTLKLKLSALHFDHKKDMISTRLTDASNNFVWDKMIVKDQNVLRNFQQLLSDLFSKKYAHL